MVSGPLGAVTNLTSTRDPFHITWEPPFSLNLTGVEPDIIYSIEIVAIVSGCNSTEDLLFWSDSNVTNNYYDGENFDPSYIYNITITPRSNVDDAIQGHTSVLKGLKIITTVTQLLLSTLYSSHCMCILNVAEDFVSLLDSSISVSSITPDNHGLSISIHFDVTVS